MRERFNTQADADLHARVRATSLQGQVACGEDGPFVVSPYRALNALVPADGPQMRRRTMGRQANDRLLTLEQAAEVLGTGSRFPRRLVAERRIRFVKVGRHVRIPMAALEEFIEAATVQPVRISR
jgi:excisionase family DNA binding protein